MIKSIYISIPMTGYDFELQRNRAKQIEHRLIKEGWHVVNPFDLSDALDKLYEKHSNEQPTYTDYLLDDITALSLCHAIYLCEGWENSKGCMAEMYFAKAIGLTIINEEYYGN